MAPAARSGYRGDAKKKGASIRPLSGTVIKLLGTAERGAVTAVTFVLGKLVTGPMEACLARGADWRKVPSFKASHFIRCVIHSRR